MCRTLELSYFKRQHHSSGMKIWRSILSQLYFGCSRTAQSFCQSTGRDASNVPITYSIHRHYLIFLTFAAYDYY